MLYLLKDGETLARVPSGGQFSLPNGDVVSPAYVGWEKDGFSLVEAPIELVEGPTKEVLRMSRQAAYTAEADPIFFMAQRDEATIDDWKAKVAEIKARFPYPSE